MSYCAQADILEQISDGTLIELTDDGGSGEIDSSVVTRAIADADAEIDGYCGTRYSLPFSPVPGMIRKISVDLAIYHLYSRRDDSIPEMRQKRYDNAVRLLRDVSKGTITLGADAPAQTNTGHTADIDYNDRIFTRDKMTGF